MQSLYPLSEADFKAKTKEVVYKLEVYIECCCYDICDFFGENRLVSIDYSNGQIEQNDMPIAAEINAVIDNNDGLFHPRNKESPFYSFLKVGRKMIFHTGFKIDGVEYMWQWFEGVISEVRLDNANRQIRIKGLDYTQYLIDGEFSVPDNYWGTDVTIPTYNDISEYILPGDCNGPYLAEFDGQTIYSEKHWTYEEASNAFVFLPEFPPGADRIDQYQSKQNGWQWLLGVGGTEEKLAQEFQVSQNLNCSKVYLLLERQGNPADNITLRIETDSSGYPSGTLVNVNATKTVEPADIETDEEWVEFEFPAIFALAVDTVYHLILQRTGARDVVNYMKWYWTSSGDYEYGESEHLANGVWGQYSDYDFTFKVYKRVGEGNLKVYYFTDQIPENVVADILVMAGLYPDQASALANMDYMPTGKIIKRVWLKKGDKYIVGIQKICELVDYRFFFDYKGTPIFKPVATSNGWKGRLFTFTQDLINEPSYFENKDEVKNHIVIEGEEYYEET